MDLPQSPRTTPSHEAVLALHHRYLLDVVEGMHLCPWARASRETGRVLRPWWDATVEAPDAATVAQALRRVAEAEPEPEIVLLTFLGHAPACPLGDPSAFDALLRAIRAHLDAAGDRTFYLVAFHPHVVPLDRAPTPDSLVNRIRRTPDPVIQCVRTSVLDRVRADAAARLQTRREAELRALLGAHAAVVPQPIWAASNPLSEQIAEANWARVGTPATFPGFEAVLDALAADRKALDLP